MLVETPTRLTGPAPASVLELICRSPAAVIAVTGASGKTTTAFLAAQMLRASGCPVVAGSRLLDVPTLTAEERVILELPLGARAPTGPAVLTLTGLAADELPDGCSMSTLTAALQRLIARTRQAVVVNADDQVARSLATAAATPVYRVSVVDPASEVALVDGSVTARPPGSATRQVICRLEETRLGAGGLVSDLLLAMATALAAGACPEALARVALLARPPDDCQETVATRRGIRWISDARATRPGRSVAALAAIAGPVLLIAGGRAGSQPLDRWAQAACRATFVLLFGPAAPAMAHAVEQKGRGRTTIVRCADLDDAVRAACRLARRGDTILFSPGCEPETELGPPPGMRFRDLATMPRASRLAAA